MDYKNSPLWHNKYFVAEMIKLNVYRFPLSYVSKKLKADEELVLLAVKKNANALSDAAPWLRCNREFVKTAIQKNGLLLPLIGERLKRDPEIVLLALTQNGLALQYALEELRNSSKYVLTAVKQNCHALCYAAPALLQDIEFVIEAVSTNGCALQYVPEHYKNDWEIVSAAINQSAKALCYASTLLQEDEGIVIAAVSKNGHVLEYASESQKSNKPIALIAVKKNGNALQFLSDALRNDEEVVLAAIRKDSSAIEYASPRLRNQREIVLAAISQCGLQFKHASEELKGNKQFLLELHEQLDFGYNPPLQWASVNLRDDKECVLSAVKNNGYALRGASQRLRDDREVALAAISQIGNAFHYVSKRLSDDRELFLLATKKIIIEENNDFDDGLLRDASARLQADRECVLAVVQQDGASLEFAAPALQADRKIVLAATLNDGNAFLYASNELSTDKELALICLKYNLYNFEEINVSLLHNAEFIAELINHCHQLYLAEKTAKNCIFNSITEITALFSDIDIYTGEEEHRNKKNPRKRSLSQCLMAEEIDTNLLQAKRAKTTTTDTQISSAISNEPQPIDCQLSRTELLSSTINRLGEKDVFLKLRQHYLEKHPNYTVKDTKKGFILESGSRKIKIKWRNLDLPVHETSGYPIPIEITKFNEQGKAYQHKYVTVSSSQFNKPAIVDFNGQATSPSYPSTLSAHGFYKHRLFKVYNAGQANAHIEKTKPSYLAIEGDIPIANEVAIGKSN